MRPVFITLTMCIKHCCLITGSAALSYFSRSVAIQHCPDTRPCSGVFFLGGGMITSDVEWKRESYYVIQELANGYPLQETSGGRQQLRDAISKNQNSLNDLSCLVLSCLSSFHIFRPFDIFQFSACRDVTTEYCHFLIRLTSFVCDLILSYISYAF